MNLLLTFTLNTSLKSWKDRGILSREVALYTKLSRKRVNVSFLTYGDKSDLNLVNQIPDIDVIPCKNYVNSKFPIINSLKTLFLPIRLKKLFIRTDIIKTNQTLGGIIGCVAKILYRKPFVVRAGYERLFNFMVKSKKKGIKNYFKYLRNYLKIYINEFMVYKLADQIILSNLPDIEFIVKRFYLKNKEANNEIHHFYNSIDINLFKPLNLTKKEKSVLYVGRLTYGKNLSNLIKAFKKLDGFVLNLIGNGPLEDELRGKVKKIGSNVNFLGVIPNEELPKIINKHQIFIIPSYFEGNPKALLEAMSCGVACIGSDIKGINNIINHEENGYLCNSDPKSIAKAIKTIYKNKQLMGEIGQNARKFIISNCDLNSIVRKEYNLYKKILKK